MLQPFTEGKAVIQLVLTPTWVTRINQLAVERGINRSALIRAAIEQTYFAEKNETQRHVRERGDQRRKLAE